MLNKILFIRKIFCLCCLSNMQNFSTVIKFIEKLKPLIWIALWILKISYLSLNIIWNCLARRFRRACNHAAEPICNRSRPGGLRRLLVHSCLRCHCRLAALLCGPAPRSNMRHHQKAAFSLTRTRRCTMDVGLWVSRSADGRLPIGQRGWPAFLEGLAVDNVAFEI